MLDGSAEFTLDGPSKEVRDLTPKSLVKLSGIALLLSGIFAAVGFSMHPHDWAGSNHATWLGAHLLVMSGGALNLFGLVGLYVVSATPLGLVGLFGFLLTAVSLLLYLGKLYWSAFIYPLVIARDADFIRAYGFNPGSDPVDPIVRIVFYLGPILFAIGYALLGLSLLRVKAYPAPALWALVVGALLVGLWPLLPGVVQHLSAVVSLIYSAGVGWTDTCWPRNAMSSREEPSNNTFDRSAGSHPLAAAGQRERWAGVGR